MICYFFFSYLSSQIFCLPLIHLKLVWWLPQGVKTLVVPNKETGSDAKEALQGVKARKALVKIWERKVPFLI